MKGRLYFADGRIVEDVNIDDRIRRYGFPDEGLLRWFVPTGQIDPDGFVVLKEMGSWKAAQDAE